MTWAKTWDNILQGGPTRWKVDDVDIKKRALAFIHKYMNIESSSFHPINQNDSHHNNNNNVGEGSKNSSLKILCPLAGDDLFVTTAWREGHDVTAIDLVPAAVDTMQRQFGGSEQDWTTTTTTEPPQGSSSDSASKTTAIWKHKSGRATLYAGDMMQERPEWNGKFDVIYDKDSFGALPLELRSKYCERLAEYCKSNQDNAIVYIEVKRKLSGGKESGGPPFHVEEEDLMEPRNFGTHFEYMTSLGEVYPLPNMSSMKQTGHILKRK